MPPRNWFGARLAGGAQRGQRAEHHIVGAEHDVDIRVGEQDGPHGRQAAFLADGSGRDVGNDVGARDVTQGIAQRDEARREEFQAVLGQQHDLGLAAERSLDMGARRVAQNLAGEILRGIQQRGRGRRHDGADVAAGPDDFLQARTERRRIDRRCDDPAGLWRRRAIVRARPVWPRHCRRRAGDIAGRDPLRPPPVPDRRPA